jgi:alkanesulfonate monooxygenase SsuD/methylene tetrahydromethanopterin reductase-like flavin-dependent oxidoreductase (luciferase family)
MAFAARWAELVFAAYPNLETGRKLYAQLKHQLAEAGRDPDAVKVAPAVKIVVAASEAQAREEYDMIASLARPIDSLALLCEVLNVDFSTRPYDAPFTDEELASVSWHSLRDRVIQKSGKKNPSVRDFVEHSGRGTVREGPVFVGTPAQVADEMQEWFESACDGFVVQALCVPRSYEDVVRLLVPELQRRGLYRRDYPGATLRDTLGLARPATRAWRKSA